MKIQMRSVNDLPLKNYGQSVIIGTLGSEKRPSCAYFYKYSVNKHKENEEICAFFYVKLQICTQSLTKGRK